MAAADGEDAKVRLDKWLWAARFYKTRALAAEAVSGGKVHLNDQRIKPAKTVKLGDEMVVLRGFDRFEIKVIALSDRRGPAKVAQTLYEETPESIQRRLDDAQRRKLERAGHVAAGHRPSGRERRKIRQISGKS